MMTTEFLLEKGKQMGESILLSGERICQPILLLFTTDALMKFPINDEYIDIDVWSASLAMFIRNLEDKKIFDGLLFVSESFHVPVKKGYEEVHRILPPEQDPDKKDSLTVFVYGQGGRKILIEEIVREKHKVNFKPFLDTEGVEVWVDEVLRSVYKTRYRGNNNRPETRPE